MTDITPLPLISSEPSKKNCPPPATSSSLPGVRCGSQTRGRIVKPGRLGSAANYLYVSKKHVDPTTFIFVQGFFPSRSLWCRPRRRLVYRHRRCRRRLYVCLRDGRYLHRPVVITAPSSCYRRTKLCDQPFVVFAVEYRNCHSLEALQLSLTPSNTIVTHFKNRNCHSLQVKQLSLLLYSV